MTAYRVWPLAVLVGVLGIACSAPDISLPRVSSAPESKTARAGDAGPPSDRDGPLPLPDPVPTRRPTKPVLVGQLNLNTADVQELALLPGIGETKAARIVAWRSRRPFGRIKDLRRVKGFGRKTLMRLEQYLVIAGPTTLRYEWPR
jgi:competence protein ComEA